MPGTSDEAPLPGQDTLVACWRALARTSCGATVVGSPRAIVATFPSFAPMNNAIMVETREVDLASEAKRLSSAYARAGVPAWAAWIPSRAPSFEAEDKIRGIDGMKRDMTTLVMQTKDLTTFRTSSAARSASIAVTTRAGEERVPTARLGDARAEAELADAACRGARTASLQSTPMGQPLYASLGFEPVGRYEEWVPE